MGEGDELYDAIVIGAGPGGGTAAFILGEAGWKVLVLEKEPLPRYKTCGGGLSSAVLKQFPFSFEPVIESTALTSSYALGKRMVTIPLPADSIQMVMRDDFDAFLVRQARAEVCAGAAVRSVRELEDRVVVETRQGQTFAGRYLIAADGASSVAARELGLRRSKVLVAAVEIETRVPSEVMRRFAGRPLFIFGELRQGYLWIFPKAEHLSVGAASYRPGPGEIQAALQRLADRYGIPLDGAPRHGHPIPLYTGREPIATRRCLLVGDAAGLVDPFSGEGIRFAIKSGRLAAECLLAGRPQEYPARVHRQIGVSHTWGLWLARLFYRFPRLCFALGMRNPFVTYAFAEMLSDRSTYPEVIVKMFATLPLFVLVETAARLAGPERGTRIRKSIYPALPL